MKQLDNLIRKMGKNGAVVEGLDLFIAFFFLLFIIVVFALFANVIKNGSEQAVLGNRIIQSEIIGKDDLPNYARADMSLLNYARTPVIYGGKEITIADILNDLTHKQRRNILELNIIFDSLRQSTSFLESVSRLAEGVLGKMQDVMDNVFADEPERMLASETKSIFNSFYNSGDELWFIVVTKQDGSIVYYEYGEKTLTYMSHAEVFYVVSLVSKGNKETLPQYTIFTNIDSYSEINLPVKGTDKYRPEMLTAKLIVFNHAKRFKWV